MTVEPLFRTRTSTKSRVRLRYRRQCNGMLQIKHTGSCSASNIVAVMLSRANHSTQIVFAANVRK